MIGTESSFDTAMVRAMRNWYASSVFAVSVLMAVVSLFPSFAETSLILSGGMKSSVGAFFDLMRERSDEDISSRSESERRRTGVSRLSVHLVNATGFTTNCHRSMNWMCLYLDL